MDLNQVSTEDLTKELHHRGKEEGWIGGEVIWPLDVYNFTIDLTPLPNVDAIPVRWESWEKGKAPEIGLILRNTGLFKGKWWSIGGRINRGESFGHAVQRQVKMDLGVDCWPAPGTYWNMPIWGAQHCPGGMVVKPSEYAGLEQRKHSVSNFYLVSLKSEEFKFGSTEHGGQEAGDFRWFPVTKLPPEEEIAYGGRIAIEACAGWAHRNLPPQMGP